MSDGPPPEDFDYGERKPDGQYENYPTVDEGEFEQEPRDTYVHVDGCGSRTTMADHLAKSVARDPEFYGKTFCAGCGEHVPVEEVEWTDGEDWVVDGDQIRTDGGTGENLYVTAIHHPNDEVRNQAFIRWLNDEIEALYEELETSDLDDMEWSRKKARMDTLSLVAGIANSRRFSHYDPVTRVGFTEGDDDD